MTDTPTFSCGHERTPENTKMKPSGRRRKDGTLRKQARCRRCYNAKRLEAWHRNNPAKPKNPRVWEVEIKVRRGRKLVAHTKDRTFAVDSMIRAAEAELALLRRTLEPPTGLPEYGSGRFRNDGKEPVIR